MSVARVAAYLSAIVARRKAEWGAEDELDDDLIETLELIQAVREKKNP